MKWHLFGGEECRVWEPMCHMTARRGGHATICSLLLFSQLSSEICEVITMLWCITNKGYVFWKERMPDEACMTTVWHPNSRYCPDRKRTLSLNPTLHSQCMRSKHSSTSTGAGLIPISPMRKSPDASITDLLRCLSNSGRLVISEMKAEPFH